MSLSLQDILQVHGRLDKIEKSVESSLELKWMMEQMMKYQMGMTTENNKND